MDVYNSPTAVPADVGPTAVAIGKFDGVHVGHRAIIGQLVDAASARSLTPVAVTFFRNPLSLLRPDSYRPPLTSNQQKVELLGDLGIEAVLFLTFDRALSDMTPDHFVRAILIDTLDARVVVVGDDFHFGAGGAGDAAMLSRLGAMHGIDVHIINAVEVATGDWRHRASTTWIRELLTDGRVREAGELLGYEPTVRGIVVHGEKRGRELGFPTANLSPYLEGFIPGDGVYAAWLTVDGERHGAAVSIGNNPTFDGVPEKQVEAYVFDVDIDLYDKVVEVSFVERIRPMLKFDGLAPLIERMLSDEQEARDLLGYPPRTRAVPTF